MNLIRKFSSYYKPHMKLFMLDMFCALGIASLDLVFPILSRNILNIYIPDKNLHALAVTAVAMLVLYVVRAVFNYVVFYWGHVVGVRMEYDMRRDLFGHLHTMDMSFFDSSRTESSCQDLSTTLTS